MDICVIERKRRRRQNLSSTSESSGIVGAAPVTALGAAVLPQVRKRAQVSLDATLLAPETVAGPVIGGIAQPTVSYDPDLVALEQASGGFNSVVEFAARFCLAHFSYRARLGSLGQQITAAELDAFLTSESGSLTTPELLALKVDPTSPLGYGLSVELSPTDITFSDPNRVCFVFSGALELEAEVYVRKSDPFERGALVDPYLRDPRGPVEQEGPLGPFVDTGEQGNVSFRGAGPGRGAILGSLRPARGRGGGRETDFAPVAELGQVSVEVCAEYGFDVDFDLKHVRVYADMRTATTKLTTPASGDGKLFWDKFLAGQEAALETVYSPPLVELAPVVSMVGLNPANVTVDEMPDFDARVHHVGEHPQQALAVMIDAMSGCQGVIEDVQQFIGNNSFGVISDEWIVDRLFRHKWRLGGFLRALELRQTIQIKRNNQPEDATLHGWMTLDTLDQVAIQTDSTGRTDAVTLGGAATTRADSVILRDGSVVGPDKVDFGPPKSSPWTIFTAPEVNPVLSLDAAMRAFELRAHADAFRFLSRPFASLPSDSAAQIAYARIEGVLKRVFYLGSLSASFD